jgi:inner membrane protein
MASIGHLAVGAAVGALYSRATGANPRVTIPAFAGLALAPDLDLISGLWGVPPNTPLSHRGITHSMAFALALGLAATLWGRSPKGSMLLGLSVFGALVSHGLLDTMSELGNGPMLLWPFSTMSYESLWRPIPGVLSAGHYLTLQAVPTLALETVMFLPLIVYALLAFFPRRTKVQAKDAVSES